MKGGGGGGGDSRNTFLFPLDSEGKVFLRGRGGNWVETIFLREDHPDLRGEEGVGGREGVEAVHWIIARR